MLSIYLKEMKILRNDMKKFQYKSQFILKEGYNQIYMCIKISNIKKEKLLLKK